LQVLLPQGGCKDGDSIESAMDGTSVSNTHGFLNISITPIECSIVCHHSLSTQIFQPFISRLPPTSATQIQISRDTYNVFSVSTSGLEAGQRVMEITAPLAMAGIPIFFITTYYTDFILVPSKDRPIVSRTLLQRGFVFEESDSSFVTPTNISPGHSRIPSTSSAPPPSPPPSNVAELQIKTFRQLKTRHVIPFVEPGLVLVQCSGKDPLSSSAYPHSRRSSSSAPPSALDELNSRLYLGLISSLLLPPRFLSLTLTADDAPSLLLDKQLLPAFGDSIAGDTEGELIPVFLDLVDLPLESTGIVCGVAGKVVDEMRRDGVGGGIEVGGAEELSYLSTARAGAVILSSEGAQRALETLLPLLDKESG